MHENAKIALSDGISITTERRKRNEWGEAKDRRHVVERKSDARMNK